MMVIGVTNSVVVVKMVLVASCWVLSSFKSSSSITSSGVSPSPPNHSYINNVVMCIKIMVLRTNSIEFDSREELFSFSMEAVVFLWWWESIMTLQSQKITIM